MTEKRLLYFALGVLSVVSVGAVSLSDTGITFPDGTVQTTAATADPRRGFYLTQATYDGAGALTACAPEYDMASLWEILDVSNLLYASEVSGARNTGDDGPIPAGFFGWIRTGWGSQSTGNPGEANCDFYSQNKSGSGTIVALNNDGSWLVEASAVGLPNGWLGPWFPFTSGCFNSFRVWCVEDL